MTDTHQPTVTQGRAQSNGGTSKQAAATDQQRQVEAGLAAYVQTAHERDELRRRLSDVEAELVTLRVEHAAVQAQLTQADSRVQTAHLEAEERVRGYRDERDAAVAARAEYEVMFFQLYSMMRDFKAPVRPLVARSVIPREEG